jgi:hypothetical protein
MATVQTKESAMSTHVEVRQLSPALVSALKSIGYGRADIQVIPATSVEIGDAGSQGRRSFTVGLNLVTGERVRSNGSWGGQNMFARNPTDDGERVDVPADGVIIKGSSGYGGTFATLYAHPDAVGAFLLPSGEPARDELTAEDQHALYCFACIKGGAYRVDELRRRNVSDSAVDSLVERGYLKRNKAGATQITTQGKNARTLRH